MILLNLRAEMTIITLVYLRLMWYWLKCIFLQAGHRHKVSLLVLKDLQLFSCLVLW